MSTGGLGLLSFDEEFNAYSLKVDWKVAGDDNSGVFVGYPEVGDDPWVAVNEGYEIQIDATDADDRTTGSVYSFQSADLPARDAALNPPGEWNSYEIVVQGQTIKVYLNGALVNDFVSTDPARDLTQGFVGIQNHGDGDDVFFRNIQIKEIADETAPVTTATFADPGPAGWHPGTVPVELSATDAGQGVDGIEYRLDDGDWTPYQDTVSVTGDGSHTLLYRASDKAGNVEAEKAATIKIDGTSADAAGGRGGRRAGLRRRHGRGAVVARRGRHVRTVHCDRCAGRRGGHVRPRGRRCTSCRSATTGSRCPPPTRRATPRASRCPS